MISPETINIGENIQALVVKALSTLSNAPSEFIKISESIQATLVKTVYNYNNYSLSSSTSDSITISENINARAVAAANNINPAAQEYNILPFMISAFILIACLIFFYLKRKKPQKYHCRLPS